MRLESLRALIPRFTPSGRGQRYTFKRAPLESALRIAYAGSWPARLWGCVPAAARVRVVRHRLSLFGDLERPLVVAFISDLHVGPTTSPATLDAAFAALRSVPVDVLLLGGDYVFLDLSREHADDLSRRIEGVPAAVKLGVLGNHDLWTDHYSIERALTRAGVNVLVNDAATLPAPFQDVAVLGLDDPYSGAPDAGRALSRAGSARHRLGLAHSPEGAMFLERSVSLLFSGHTHGGQIALPGERPVYLPPGPYSRRFPAGLHRSDDLWLFVSRGVGATDVPVRMYAPPEVAIFELT